MTYGQNKPRNHCNIVFQNDNEWQRKSGFHLCSCEYQLKLFTVYDVFRIARWQCSVKKLKLLVCPQTPPPRPWLLLLLLYTQREQQFVYGELRAPGWNNACGFLFSFLFSLSRANPHQAALQTSRKQPQCCRGGKTASAADLQVLINGGPKSCHYWYYFICHLQYVFF